ncbi:MAG: terminase, partial [bacterium]
MSEISEFLERYYDNPVGFVEDVLQVTPEPWQKDILNAFARGDRKISIRSGHGVGKTAAASWLLLFHTMTRIPQKSVCTACTATQLYDSLFAEIKIWIERLPKVMREWLDYTSSRVVLKASPNESFIVARTARAEQPDALQGIHSDHVLLIVDEAAAVAEPVYEAASSSMTSEHACMILLGNPTSTSGYFYETFHRLSDDWTNFHVSCFDSSRSDKNYPIEMAAMYGEESNQYRTRVLGEWAKDDVDSWLSTELVAGAVLRDVEVNPDAEVVWGLDVARYGQDSSALCKRKGNHIV